MDWLIVVYFLVLGAVLGSFCCCQVRRIQLKTAGKKSPGKRSVCLKCGKKLEWFENVPILSWVIQKGKCRKCGAEIGKAEILTELVGAATMGVAIFRFLRAGEFGVWGLLMLGVVVAFLTTMLIVVVYDALSSEMPARLLYVGIGLGVVGFFINAVGLSDGRIVERLVSGMVGVVILGGMYFFLYKISKEKLVGEGDYLMCVGIALMLGDWWLSLIALFLANFVGAIVMMPLKKKRIPFGPFLYFAFVVVFGFAEFFLKLLWA